MKPLRALGTREFRENLAEVLEDAASGQPVRITRRGRDVYLVDESSFRRAHGGGVGAVITSYLATRTDGLTDEEHDEIYGNMRDDVGPDPVVFE